VDPNFAKEHQDHALREKSYMLHAKPTAYKAIGRTRQVHHTTLVLASGNSLETLVDTRFFNHVLTCSERTPSDTGALFISHHRGANSVCRMFCIYIWRCLPPKMQLSPVEHYQHCITLILLAYTPEVFLSGNSSLRSLPLRTQRSYCAHLYVSSHTLAYT
jgi:hypothetical protein